MTGLCEQDCLISSPGDFTQPPAEALLLLKLRSDLAFWRVLVRGLQLQLLWKAGVNPDQPRDDHGRWTGTGAGTRVAQAGGVERYRVSLPEEEARGGHAIRTHVGKSDGELIAKVKEQTVYVWPLTAGKLARGSFDSVEAANNFVNRVLEDHPEQVDRVVSGVSSKEWLETRFGYSTGKEAFRPVVNDEPYVRTTYNVGGSIRSDPRSPLGCTVITTYPKNDIK